MKALNGAFSDSLLGLACEQRIVTIGRKINGELIEPRVGLGSKVLNVLYPTIYRFI